MCVGGVIMLSLWLLTWLTEISDLCTHWPSSPFTGGVEEGISIMAFSSTQRPVTNNHWEDGWSQSNRAWAHTDYESCSHRHSTGQGACQNQWAELEWWGHLKSSGCIGMIMKTTYWAAVHLPMFWGIFQLSSVAQSCLTLFYPMGRSTTGLPVHHQLLGLTQTHLHWLSDAIQTSRHLSSSSPPASIFSSIRVFSNESVLHIRWPKYWSFSFNISPSNEHPGLISFRMDWLHLLVVQGTFKSLLQHHSSKASILRHSDFFIVQISHPYMTTGKTRALPRWTFVDKVMFCNILSRLVRAFLPKSKHLLISWLQSSPAVIFGDPQNKVSHYFQFFPFYLSWNDGTRCHGLSFLNVEF